MKWSMRWTVPSGAVVFKETSYNALKVSVTDQEGELAKAGLADGDLVVAVNGKEFEGAMQMQMMLSGAMARGEDARLTIQRGGRTLEVTVNLKKIMMGGGGKAGGSVRPAVR